MIQPLMVIGSKQANAYIGSTDLWAPCLNAAAGMGGGHCPMVVYIEYEDESELCTQKLELNYEQDNSQG